MWDIRYDREDYFYGTEPNDFLKEQVGKLPCGRILCIADGEGRNGVYLAGLGFEVTSVDSSEVGLRKTQALAEDRGVFLETIHADLAEYDLGKRCWDGIVSIFCHLQPPLRRQVYDAAQRALKPGGVLLLEGYTAKQLSYNTGGPPKEELMLSEHILSKELPKLKFDLLQEIEREVHEGRGHRGHSAVVQALATR